MELIKLNQTYVIRVPARSVWKFIFVALFISSFSVSFTAGLVSYFALRASVQQITDQKREIESLTFEARKWSVEASRCVQKILDEAEKKPHAKTKSK